MQKIKIPKIKEKKGKQEEETLEGLVYTGETKKFESYLSGYRELISLLRSELGVEKLNNENKKLIK